MGEAVGSQFLEISKTHLDLVRSNFEASNALSRGLELKNLQRSLLILIFL